MKKYQDKYIKYKTKYLKIKNHQTGGETFDCSDEKNKPDIVCEQKLDGQWDNIEECTKSNICIENKRLIDTNEPSDKIIMFMRKYKKLLEKYNLFNYDILKSFESLESIYELIILFEKNKDIIEMSNKKKVDIPSILENNKYRIYSLINNLKSIEYIRYLLLKNYIFYDINDSTTNPKIEEELQDNLKSIILIEKNKDLLNKYDIYTEKDKLPRSYLLQYKLDMLNFMIQNKDLYKKDGINIDEFKFPKDNQLEEQEKYKQLKIKIEVIKSIEANPQSIKLIEQNPELKQYVGYRKDDIVKNVEKIQQDIDNIKKFHDECKIFNIPKSFNISGLVTFAVYKNIKLNKIIYLLGEQHNYKTICDIEKKDDVMHYNAGELFFSLLKLNVQGKNNGTYKDKLDIFLELKYNPINENYNPSNEKFHDKNTIKEHIDSYMTNTQKLIYDNHCYPLYFKNSNKEKEYEICMYDPYVRFHHADLRKINDEFVKYITYIYYLYYKSKGIKNYYITFIYKYEKYSQDINYVSNIYTSSKFLNKINKQIDNIDDKNIKEEFKKRVIKLKEMCIKIIESGDINYNNVLQIFNDSIKDKQFYVFQIFIDIMDLYLMSRVFRVFNKDKVLSQTELSYKASNIIIYAGNTHIINYARLLEKLEFIKIHNFTNSSGIRSCIKVNNFNVEYF